MVKTMPKKYYARIIENELDQMLGIFGAVLIEGPKWCGKTTTAGTRAASRLLLMDPSRNFENRFRAETDPGACRFWRGAAADRRMAGGSETLGRGTV